MMKHAFVVVEAEQQRADELAFGLLVPTKPRDDAVGRPRVLDLDHQPLAWRVRERVRLRDDAIEPGALEAFEPVLRGLRITSDRRDMYRRLRLRERVLERGAAL